MSHFTLNDALRHIGDEAAREFPDTAVAPNVPTIARRATRRRTLKRGGVAMGAVAATGSLALAGGALLRSLGSSTVEPASPSLTASMPVPSPTVSVPATDATVTFHPGHTLDHLNDTLRETWGHEVWSADLYWPEFVEASNEWVSRQDAADSVPATAVVGSLEGWIAPGDYSAAIPGGNPDNWIRARVTERFDELATLGVAPEDMNRVLTVASIIEREVALVDDYPLMAALIENRLDAGMNLELDSTVAYAVRGTAPADTIHGHVVTTAEARASDSPYNTYRFPGLPPGPVSAPSHEAIVAALSPADSEVLYVSPIDLTTGEFAFAETFEEHLDNVERFREWVRSQESAG